MHNIENLYEKWRDRIVGVTKRFPDEDIEGPFLIDLLPGYQGSRKRLLVFGQETHGWYCDYGDFSRQIEGYRTFNLGESYRPTPFWDFVRRLELAVCGQHYTSAWLNLNRFDMNSGRPTPEVEALISELDPLILDELAILEPQIVVFLTGPNYDSRLQSIFPDVKFLPDAGNSRQFSRIESRFLPKNTFRTYHPGYLRRSGMEELIFTRLMSEIQT